MSLNQQQLEAILTAIDNKALQRYCIHLYKSVSSTNTVLWQLLSQGAKPATIAIAQQQTAGRGQWGRQWTSEAGGLYLSYAIAPQTNAIHSYQLTMGSAWGIATALRDRGIPVSLKWPNDLILCGRKLGGILTETKICGGKITQAVIGVGINWANPVPKTGINLRSFLMHQTETAMFSLETLAAVTILGITAGCEAGNEILPAYEKLLTSIGRTVTIDGHSGTIIGVAVNGNLRVRLYHDSREVLLPVGAISLGYEEPEEVGSCEVYY
ncbi:biotin--[acetyl-CoA-carboxylase] ligase [Gloeocapsopsis dulcis]|uniref:Biotin--[acetyl-CoA-carboxylase] ligase n=1 Tax=Gloeocapsopsis dulcis AAB1 = 1H9 TaxID=1433147 RepID=A0A6N8FWM2_9CHRO|nr:biotin--[acetyl-CoA-carboxylase] ligase [Gloeocapsopsis dulcis]MUL36705.1 biotin--[acetyl-CoA-carboxylase] ligase [Gloeocapsopsis dulcis AAB1 = 1H9]WNN91278.1 biotin--[acetyl-CoA-carboxylase] ligase [Gloeocapsopsis dulcis]